jgi:thioredoxin 1
MAYEPQYASSLLTRAEVDQMHGPVLLEFGANWCGHCSELAPRLKALLDMRPDFPHIKIEDGRGKPLGRSFRVKLWPTLVFMRDGQVLLQMARPSDSQIRDGLEALFGV